MLSRYGTTQPCSAAAAPDYDWDGVEAQKCVSSYYLSSIVF